MSRARLVCALTLAAVASVLPASAAEAAGPPVVVVTEHPIDDVVQQLDQDPCTGAPILLTSTRTGVAHVTRFADGTVHFGAALHARFVAVLWPGGEPDAEGTYTVHGGGNGAISFDGSPFDRAEITATVNGAGSRPDGASFRFHRTSHAVIGPDGVPRVELGKAHCS